MSDRIYAGAVIGGKYQLESQLGGGGMGAVWRGMHGGLDVPVAVKFMNADLVTSSKARARFEREAKAAALIRSLHVVQIYDHGIDEGTPFIVMELLEGEDLAARLKREGQLPLAEAARICREVCKGLHHAHRRNVVHRDLKPGNIFLCGELEDMVKLLDFGIARADGVRVSDEDLTEKGTMMGSPQYMSPEQVRGIAVDGRTDLWAVAVVLYRMLVTRRPISANNFGDLVLEICSGEIEPPSRFRPELGDAVDRFFAKAFCREPDGRFATARDFAAAFGAATERLDPREPITRELMASWDDRTEDSNSATHTVGSDTTITTSVPYETSVPHETTTRASEDDAPTQLVARRSAWRWIVAPLAVLALTGAFVALQSPGDVPLAETGLGRAATVAAALVNVTPKPTASDEPAAAPASASSKPAGVASASPQPSQPLSSQPLPSQPPPKRRERLGY